MHHRKVTSGTGASAPQKATRKEATSSSAAAPVRPRTLNIKEFADAIGVSPTTVSRSISQRGRISPRTRKMVLQRMEELGYTPNLHAQRLVSGRAQTVALHFDLTTHRISELFLVGLMRALQQSLQQQGFGLLLTGPNDTLARWAQASAVDGIVAVGGGEDDTQLAQTVSEWGVPCVVVTTQPLPKIPGVAAVVIDLAGGAQQAARALVEQGHREIGFIGSSYSHGILPSFSRTLEELGAPLDPRWTVIAGDESADGERAMQQILSQDQRPSAVFARTDELAAGAMRAARRMGLSLPGDLSIIGHDDLPFAAFLEPTLSTVRINCDCVGEMATKALFYLLEHPEADAVRHTVSTELVLRESVVPMTEALTSDKSSRTS